MKIISGLKTDETFSEKRGGDLLAEIYWKMQNALLKKAQELSGKDTVTINDCRNAAALLGFNFTYNDTEDFTSWSITLKFGFFDSLFFKENKVFKYLINHEKLDKYFKFDWKFNKFSSTYTLYGKEEVLLELLKNIKNL